MHAITFYSVKIMLNSMKVITMIDIDCYYYGCWANHQQKIIYIILIIITNDDTSKVKNANLQINLLNFAYTFFSIYPILLKLVWKSAKFVDIVIIIAISLDMLMWDDTKSVHIVNPSNRRSVANSSVFSMMQCPMAIRNWHVICHECYIYKRNEKKKIIYIYENFMWY